jgi:BMFP domain-containing protein YqiC
VQTENPLLDDLARVATGALGALTGMRAEVEARIRDQLERVFARMDLVTREEFDAVRAMAAKARLEQEALARRLEALEGRLQAPEAAPAKRSRRRRAKPAGTQPAAPDDTTPIPSE